MEYFEPVRLPQENWKTIEDLRPQLAEFDLRYDGQDYETAGWVVAEISFDYMILWGWNRFVTELIGCLLSKVLSPRLRAKLSSEQGHAYLALGQARQAIHCHEQTLAIDRETGDRKSEGADLNNLGLAHAALGRAERAIEFHEQAIVIAREVASGLGEGAELRNLGGAHAALGRFERAI